MILILKSFGGHDLCPLIIFLQNIILYDIFYQINGDFRSENKPFLPPFLFLTAAAAGLTLSRARRCILNPRAQNVHHDK